MRLNPVFKRLNKPLTLLLRKDPERMGPNWR